MAKEMRIVYLKGLMNNLAKIAPDYSDIFEGVSIDELDLPQFKLLLQLN